MRRYNALMHARLTFFALALISLFIPLSSAHAETMIRDVHYKAQVQEVVESGSKTVNDIRMPYQIVKIRFLEAPMKGKEMTIHHGDVFSIDQSQYVTPGQKIVVVETTGPDGTRIYAIIDTYRLDALIPFLLLFVAAVILLSRWRGVGSIFGMIVSLLVIAKYIVPQIISGADPLTTSIIGCLGIMIVTLYLAHGFSRQTTVALLSTFLTLVFTGALSIFFVRVMHLSGLGSDDAYSLKLGVTAVTNYKGLFLSGILIGALGVLDDVTTGLSASVFELHKANKKLTFIMLISAGLRIGREHVASLVNTLVLAYAGVSLPLFMTLIINPNGYPLWTILNSEMIIEEIVRTLTGSLGLILAVPLTTFLAASVLTSPWKNPRAIIPDQGRKSARGMLPSHLREGR